MGIFIAVSYSLGNKLDLILSIVDVALCYIAQQIDFGVICLQLNIRGCLCTNLRYAYFRYFFICNSARAF